MTSRSAESGSDGRRRRLIGAAVIVTLVAVVGLAAGHSGGGSPAAAAMVSAPPAQPLISPKTVFPLRVGPTGRYLVDAYGRPFLIVGDSPQALIGDLSETAANRFFANRAAAGFNSVWINLLCDAYTGCRSDGRTYNGIAPFTTADDVSTPNPAYFRRADAMIRLAADHHLAVFLDPIETGGWLDVLRQNGVAKDYRFGRYLGARYRAFSNVVWLNGNDFQTWKNADDDALALSVARGIRAADPDALQTVELNYPASTSLSDPRWRTVVGLDLVYTYGPTYVEVRRAFTAGAHTPVFLGEASYEGEHYYSSPETLRRQEYWSILSGSSGQFYGNHYTWQFLNGWTQHLDTVGSRQLTFVADLFSRRSWYDLVPDFHHHLVVAGYGRYTRSGTANDSDYATAAATPDGRLAIAYLPTDRAVTVDMARMAGPRVRAQFYDPTDGRYEPAAGSLLSPHGVHVFRAPGENAAGDSDWILLLSTVGGVAGNGVPTRLSKEHLL